MPELKKMQEYSKGELYRMVQILLKDARGFHALSRVLAVLLVIVSSILVWRLV